MPSSKSVLLDISGLFGLPSVAVKPSTSPIFLMTATVKFSPATSLPMRATATAVHTPAAGDDDPTFEEEEDFTKHPLPSIDCALEPSIADVKTVLFRTIDESVGKLSTFPHVSLCLCNPCVCCLLCCKCAVMLQIGPDIWPYVSWNRPLESVNPFPAFHDIISAHKAAIEAVLLSHAGPLEAVVGMVKELAIGLNSDVSGSLQRWQARIRGKTSLKLAPIVREIQAHRSAMESLSLQTPNTVAVGLFEVSLVHVKEQIWGTHSAHANGLLRLLSDWCDDTAEAISAQAGDIRSKVRARCKTVDEAMAAEAFCSNAPAYISKLNRGLAALFQAMDALDSFQ